VRGVPWALKRKVGLEAAEQLLKPILERIVKFFAESPSMGVNDDAIFRKVVSTPGVIVLNNASKDYLEPIAVLRLGSGEPL
jgi:hypothetical protein